MTDPSPQAAEAPPPAPPAPTPVPPADEEPIRALCAKILANQETQRATLVQQRALDLAWQTRVDSDIRVLKEGQASTARSVADLRQLHSDLREEHDSLAQSTNARLDDTDGQSAAIQGDLAHAKGSLRADVDEIKTKLVDLQKADGELASAIKSSASEGAAAGAAAAAKDAVTDILRDRRIREALKTSIYVALSVVSTALTLRFVAPPAAPNASGVLLPAAAPTVVLHVDGGTP